MASAKREITAARFAESMRLKTHDWLQRHIRDTCLPESSEKGALEEVGKKPGAQNDNHVATERSPTPGAVRFPEHIPISGVLIDVGSRCSDGPQVTEGEP